MEPKNKAVFFDRDGTLIHSLYERGRPIAIRDFSQFKWKSDAVDVLFQIKARGYKTVLITNQPDVEKGIISQEFVDKINLNLKEKLGLDLVKVTYRSESSDPYNYKPNPGLVLDAGRVLNIDFQVSFFIGDRWRDIEAGINVGCQTILLESESHEKITKEPDFKVRNLLELLNIIT